MKTDLDMNRSSRFGKCIINDIHKIETMSKAATDRINKIEYKLRQSYGLRELYLIRNNSRTGGNNYLSTINYNKRYRQMSYLRNRF